MIAQCCSVVSNIRVELIAACDNRRQTFLRIPNAARSSYAPAKLPDGGQRVCDLALQYEYLAKQNRRQIPLRKKVETALELKQSLVRDCHTFAPTRSKFPRNSTQRVLDFSGYSRRSCSQIIRLPHVVQLTLLVGFSSLPTRKREASNYCTDRAECLHPASPLGLVETYIHTGHYKDEACGTKNSPCRTRFREQSNYFFHEGILT